MNQKRVIALSMAAVTAAFMMCGQAYAGGGKNDAGTDIKADLSLWAYPVGGLGSEAAWQSLIDDFSAQYPDVNVTVRMLDYTYGDDQVNTAIEEGSAPDLVFEGPERLVAGWGEAGVMADISDLWDESSRSEIYENVAAACRSAEDVYYEYPVCMTAHTMAVNRDVFEAADALQYLDEETGTWTTDGFLKAVQAVCDYRVSQGEDDPAVGAVYCGGQGGDQGTRALINNLYGGRFTNAEHTGYTVNSQENAKALQAVVDSQGLKFDPSIVGRDEINLFVSQILSVAFCWNVGEQTAHAGKNAGFTILPMAFPSDDGIPELCGGIWGFGVFDSGDPDRIEASKAFIRFLDGSAGEYAKAVTSSAYFPVRDTAGGEDVSKMYDGNETMAAFSIFMPYFGDYYQVVPGWAEARTAWWNMLQQIGSGEDIRAALETFDRTASAAAEAAQS